jgi:hypothetical protein
MSYDNSNNLVETFFVAGLTNATVSGVANIRVPTHKGVRFAAIEDIKALVGATSIANTTTPVQIQIGTAVTPGKFAGQPVGNAPAGLATGQTWSVADVDGRVAAYNPASGVGKGCIDLGAGGDGDSGAAIRDLRVSTLVGTGGTAAGAFSGWITVRWF